ncbi:MAG: DNA polymerase III subunit alpha [Gammaproteobacteria bacterium RIFCSPHIGHO2_12_FULL_41_20]|nr:MAG: DNA polymerase III subunit alpha [Gammaproteobacteria bacterium RIFCSPHIGHO2_12_FULL_41_20]
MNPSYIHLRLHTEYSIHDGLIQIPSLIDEVIKQNMPAIAITDQNNLFGTVKFYQASISAGIKPIIGADLWLRDDKQAKHLFRLTLLCQTNQGYHHLLQLISRSYQEGQINGLPTITYQWLKEFNHGLIALSGAQEGDLGQAILAENSALIQKCVDFWSIIFPDRYYIELRRTGHATEHAYLNAALTLSESRSLPVVATNDIRFLFANDFEAHETRVCIQDGRILSDPHRPHLYTEQQYLRTPAEMCQLFTDIPEALTNSVEIAKRCNVTLTLNKHFLPHFSVPAPYTAESHMAALAKQGLEERLALLYDNQTETFAIQRRPYDTRLEKEIQVINSMGFAGYFLIVADFTCWARTNNIPVGPGRGSGPGSLVAYALKITDLDPLAHDLLFERFLNPERISLPDFDIDFCMDGRDRVIDYVTKTHGHDSVAQIITYGTMAARAVVRDVGRVLGFPYGFVDKIAKLIPFELGMTLEKALEQEPLLLERYQQEEEMRTLIDLARKLEGLTRNVGKHAGGLVIAPGKLTDFTPLYCEPGSPDHIVTQFDKDDVEMVGLVKFDFLGLKTLTIIQRALDDVNARNTTSPIDVSNLAKNDTQTFALLKACKTNAVFQLESRGMRDLVKRLQPDCFEDLIALVALFRPGPLQSGMVEDFINRKHGRAKVFYPHPKLEPILRSTYGVILYQEQVMQIAQVLAGYTLGAADLLRRAMGKKKPEEMAKQREVFCCGAIERGVNQDIANHIFDLMEKFAGYGFNKSHSASYALIAYQTAWLKAHYPAAYMAAVLSSDMDKTDKIVFYIEECRALGLHVAPPDLNQSYYRFQVIDDKHLRYGLGAIKGVGEAAIDSILTSRQQHGPFQSLFDFCQRCDLRKANRRVMEALIKSGAMDGFGIHRASLIATLPTALQQAEQTLQDKARGQKDLFSLECDTLTQHIVYTEVPTWDKDLQLQGEKETLGYYLSGHPIQSYFNELEKITTCRLMELQHHMHKQVIIAGIITQIKTKQTKRGDRIAIVTIDDSSAAMEVLCFADTYQKYHALLNKDQIIVLRGDVGMDEFNGGQRVICRELYSIEQAREHFSKYLQITMHANANPDVQQLAELLSPYRGGRCAILVHYGCNGATAQLQLGEAWRVRPTETLLQTLLETALVSQVEMVY